MPFAWLKKLKQFHTKIDILSAMGRGVSWSEADIALVRAELTAGFSAAEIVKKYPTWPRSSIQKLVAKLRGGAQINNYRGKCGRGGAKIKAAAATTIQELAAAPRPVSLAEMQEAVLAKHAVGVTKQGLQQHLKGKVGAYSLKKAFAKCDAQDAERAESRKVKKRKILGKQRMPEERCGWLQDWAAASAPEAGV